MTLSQLANKESELYLKVVDIYDGKSNFSLSAIYAEYQIIHNEYARLSEENIECLKRGLFIQWYSLAEPEYLTGINELSERSERKIIKELKSRIDQNETDEELLWMLNYYLDWDWVFERFSDIVDFRNIVKKVKKEVPKIKTDKRGQMGFYWESILAE